MDTQLLEAFVAVAESGSFSIAADRVHITQPAVSKRIAQLEDILGCRLFDRISRTIYLTQAGQELLPRATKILAELRETRQAIRDLSGHISGSLRIAISHHIGLHRLPPILKEFAGSNPEVSLEVEFMDSEVAYDAVLHGRFEVAVITLAPEPHPRILSHKIWEDPLELMVSTEHPLAQKNPVNIEALSKFPAILPGMETYTGRMIKKLFDNGNFNLNATMATNYLETIKMLVSVGLGWSILPSIMKDDSLQILTCGKLRLSRQLGYIQHNEKTLSNAGRAFISLLESRKEQI
ncbi:MAG: LysR family transcriptional regulator [Porticoccaceae bacterium]|jgi:DNA-binding transcriptional LysR family regulator